MLKIPAFFCCPSRSPKDEDTIGHDEHRTTEDITEAGRQFSNATSRASNDSGRTRLSADRANSGALFERKFISPFRRAEQSIKYSAQATRSVSGELPTPEQVEDFYALYGRLTRLEKKLESRKRLPPLRRPPNVPDLSAFNGPLKIQTDTPFSRQS